MTSFMPVHEPHWSAAERAVARKAFERALQRELGETIAEAKRIAARIQTPEQLWNLEDFLTRRRKQIDRKYDYRYSVLLTVFGSLMREGRLQEADLRGLDEDKIAQIRRNTSF